MEGKNREIILANYDYLLQHIKLTQAFYDKCIETGLLTALQVFTIKKSANTDEYKKSEILNDIVTQKPDSFCKFKDVLRLSGHFLVVKELQRLERQYTNEWRGVHSELVRLLNTRFIPEWEDKVIEYIQRHFVTTQYFPVAFQTSLTKNQPDVNANHTEALIQQQEKDLERLKKECARLREENKEMHKRVLQYNGKHGTQQVWIK